MLVITVTVSILLIVSLFVNYNLLKKVEIYEETAETLDKEREEAIQLIVEINKRLGNDFVKLREVDRRGVFEADDEVGFIFSTIFTTVEDTYNYLTNYAKIEKIEEEV